MTHTASVCYQSDKFIIVFSSFFHLKYSNYFFHSEIMTSNGNGKFNFVPCTWRISNLRATLIIDSFFKSSNYNVIQNAEFASTLRMIDYFLFLS